MEPSDKKPTVEGLMELVAEYGRDRYNESASDAAFERRSARQHREDGDETLAAIRAYAAALSSTSAKEPGPTEFTRRVAELLVKVPLPPKAITYDGGWDLLNELQSIAVDMNKGA